MNGTDTNHGGAASGLLLSALRGFAATAVVGMVLIILLTLVIYMMPDPDRYLRATAIFCLYGSAVVGGAFAGRSRNGTPVSGLICGLLLLALILTASAFDNDAGPSFGFPITALLYAGVPAASMLGALVFASGAKREKRPKMKKRRR